MRTFPFFKTLACLAKDRVPGQLVIQITNQCNAKCPQCGMRKTADIRRTRLGTDTIRQILDAAGEKGIQAVSFTGGEPLLHLDSVAGLISHAGRAGIPYIRTGTNGFLFCGSRQPGFKDRIKAWWHQETRYVPITKAAWELSKQQGFYKDNPGTDPAIKQLNLNTPTPNSRGARFSNFVQIRDIINDEMEAIWNGSKTAADAIDGAGPSCGNLPYFCLMNPCQTWMPNSGPPCGWS